MGTGTTILLFKKGNSAKRTAEWMFRGDLMLSNHRNSARFYELAIMTDEQSLHLLLLIAGAAIFLVGIAFISSLVDLVVNFFKSYFVQRKKDNQLERLEREISILKSGRVREQVNVEGDRQQLVERLTSLSLANFELRRAALLLKNEIEETNKNYSKLALDNEELRKIVDPFRSKIEILEKEIGDIQGGWKIAVIERDAIIEAYLALASICDEKFQHAISAIEASTTGDEDFENLFGEMKKALRKDILTLRKSIVQLETIFLNPVKKKNMNKYKFE